MCIIIVPILHLAFFLDEGKSFESRNVGIVLIMQNRFIISHFMIPPQDNDTEDRFNNHVRVFTKHAIAC